ncbi:hypothetical protein K439DRAFT_751060 [Ramaria rubella]|nr:hypothetical protein K439DRAFT_751060 [Ramaria rubella]
MDEKSRGRGRGHSALPRIGLVSLVFPVPFPFPLFLVSTLIPLSYAITIPSFLSLTFYTISLRVVRVVGLTYPLLRYPCLYFIFIPTPTPFSRPTSSPPHGFSFPIPHRFLSTYYIVHITLLFFFFTVHFSLHNYCLCVSHPSMSHNTGGLKDTIAQSKDSLRIRGITT